MLRKLNKLEMSFDNERWDIATASEVLGIARSTMYRSMRALNIHSNGNGLTVKQVRRIARYMIEKHAKEV